MINLEKLLSDIQEWIKTDNEIKNALIRINNQKSDLEKEAERMQRERVRKVKLPLRLVIHQKYVFDDLNNPEELERHRQAIKAYNKDVDAYNKLLDKDKRMVNEIAQQIKALTYEQYQDAMNGQGTLEEFNKLKNTWRVGRVG